MLRHQCVRVHAQMESAGSGFVRNFSLFSISLSRAVGPTGPFFPSCLPGTLLNTATYAQALSHVASLKGKLLNLGVSSKSIPFKASGMVPLPSVRKPLGNGRSLFLFRLAVVALISAAHTKVSFLSYLVASFVAKLQFTITATFCEVRFSLKKQDR